ncbi:hypothetical protein T440DRAFT_195613 [Plenodomus tracheiphilus IPT5]|uniref:Autophagy-related protein 17 n=1 Tax=Plenodomus tracheiphilus IPT5 TaxID=1408161 RepID=A0A6A7AWC9_9PLEO|nr:hypothetical protein T440DRAFT_195613 [Plenodomus tracheiphilus IPT5]
MAAPSPASSTSSVASRPSAEPDLNRPHTLEQLVNYFVASKRALHTQTVLWRATEIVSTARELLEENAVLAAKNTAVRNIADRQVDALEAVRRGIDVVEAEVETEFKQLLHDVDTSFSGLTSTLAVLRETPIEAVLQPPGTPQKHLYDFIDSATVSNLEADLRACIDRYNEAHATLDDSNDAFDTSLDNLHSSIDNVPVTPSSPDNPSPIPALYRQLENHAKEAAQAFQSLVSHYDLCITALRHTEGGSAAATQATGDDAALPSHSSPTSPDPLSEDERQDMLTILHKDSQDVDPVATEIRSRGSEMEFLLSRIQQHISHLRHESSALSSILTILSTTTTKTHGYLSALQTFQLHYTSHTRPALVTGIEESSAQRDFYLRFDLAYAELLVEISARRRRYEKMAKKAQEAQRELDRLAKEDQRCREEFTRQQGDYLPLDIWRGGWRRGWRRRWGAEYTGSGEGCCGEGVDEGQEEDVTGCCHVVVLYACWS